MTGCGDAAGCGIQAQRQADRERVHALLRRIRPDGAWQGAVLERVVREGLDVDSCRRLAARIAELLPVRVLPTRARSTELGDSLYLLVGLHAPCLLELREGTCRADAPVVRAEESYLRVALSPLGRFAALQETRLAAEDLGDGARLIVERPCLGVEDRDLRLIVTGVQGLLRKEEVVLLDFAFLMQPLEGAVDRALVDRWASPPTLWSVLFDPAPPTTTREVVV